MAYLSTGKAAAFSRIGRILLMNLDVLVILNLMQQPRILTTAYIQSDLMDYVFWWQGRLRCSLVPCSTTSLMLWRLTRRSYFANGEQAPKQITHPYLASTTRL
jgi:hypothetical protein